MTVYDRVSLYAVLGSSTESTPEGGACLQGLAGSPLTDPFGLWRGLGVENATDHCKLAGNSQAMPTMLHALYDTWHLSRVTASCCAPMSCNYAKRVSWRENSSLLFWLSQVPTGQALRAMGSLKHKEPCLR